MDYQIFVDIKCGQDDQTDEEQVTCFYYWAAASVSLALGMFIDFTFIGLVLQRETKCCKTKPVKAINPKRRRFKKSAKTQKVIAQVDQEKSINRSQTTLITRIN